MANVKIDRWLTSSEIRKIFLVADKTLHDRGVKARDTGERKEFHLVDFWAKCADLVVKKLKETGLGSALEDTETLKAEKLAEEIRKLKITNDENEGLLVLASDVEATWSRHVRAMADELDAMVSRVKMACPDLPQSALAVISDQLSAARNKAAGAKKIK